MRSSQDRLSAIRQARQYLSLQPLYLDTETTGNERDSEIVEIGIVDAAGKPVFESLVRPTRHIPQEVIRLHGIDDEVVAAAPRWNTIWPVIETILANHTIGIYNREFDLRLMSQSHARYWLKWQLPPGADFFCIMTLYAQYHGEWNASQRRYKWQSLELAGWQCKIDLPNSHRAVADALLARAVLHAIAAAR
jgi:DNA polymerase-3 subunit epsilon